MFMNLKVVTRNGYNTHKKDMKSEVIGWYRCNIFLNLKVLVWKRQVDKERIEFLQNSYNYLIANSYYSDALHYVCMLDGVVVNKITPLYLLNKVLSA